jgi:hypothetical protein
VHIVDKAEDFKEKARRRLVKTLINGRIVYKVFKSDYTKSLQILCFINDYNHYIGGVNLVN